MVYRIEMDVMDHMFEIIVAVDVFTLKTRIKQTAFPVLLLVEGFWVGIKQIAELLADETFCIKTFNQTFKVCETLKVLTYGSRDFQSR